MRAQAGSAIFASWSWLRDGDSVFQNALEDDDERATRPKRENEHVLMKAVHVLGEFDGKGMAHDGGSMKEGDCRECAPSGPASGCQKPHSYW